MLKSESVQVGQLRAWVNEPDLIFLVVRVGPDASEPLHVLTENEVEIQYPSHEVCGTHRHARLTRSIANQSFLIQESQ